LHFRLEMGRKALAAEDGRQPHMSVLSMLPKGYSRYGESIGATHVNT
jgi:hypothetical protein